MDLDLFSRSDTGHLIPIRGTDGRTGRAYDHMAFVPKPLGDGVTLSPESWRAVSRASLALGRLDQASIQLPNPALLRRPTLRREAQSTSALEGTFAPLERVLADDEEPDDDEPQDMAALAEVLHYVRAADQAFNWIMDGRRITVGLLEEAQRTLVRGTRSEARDPGQVGTIQVAIGADRAPIEEARFIPMPPGVELTAALRDLVDWISDSDRRDPIISAAMAHYQFEALHPFVDGNGPIGRMLIVLQLMADKVLREPLLSVSPWFEMRRDEYQEHLFNVSARGDWDVWVRFFGAGLEAAAEDTLARVGALLDLQADYQERLREGGVRSGLARDIATWLIGYPSFTVPSMTKRLAQATPQGVSTAIGQLVKLGILRKHTRPYRHRYIAPEVVNILSSEVGWESSYLRRR